MTAVAIYRGPEGTHNAMDWLDPDRPNLRDPDIIGAVVGYIERR
jgi:hypothetical protein